MDAPRDARRFSPSAARNRGPILDTLRPRLPAAGLLLEVASGTGEHCAHLAAALPSLTVQPTDPDPEALASVNAWCATLPNVRPALPLDAAALDWPVTAADAVLCINMIHIAPWEATIGLIRGAAKVLPAGGLLYLYGPFRRAGIPTAPSNDAFDQDLRMQNPAWGLRELETVTSAAAAEGFGLPEVVEMPANNLSVFFRRSGDVRSRAG